jgi:F420-dependent oxidoreductase-like protein
MELRLPAPCLVVLVGPSASGKSTWAAGTFHETEIVSSDRLRGMVGAGEDDQRASKAAFSILEQIVEERMARNLTTVIDTLGFDRESRRRWVGLAHGVGLPAFAIVFDTPAAEAEVRNSKRARPLPKTVLTRQIGRFRTVRTELDEDGFDQIHVEQPVALVALTVATSSVGRPPLEGVGGSGHSFGLMVNRFDWGGDRLHLAQRLTSIARRAEQAGFRDLWVMDHFRQIPHVGRAWEDMPEAHTVLSYLAGVTSKIRLGTLVSGVGHRHPVVLGKAVATLDVLSGGRANLGLGLGWDRNEHEGYGIPFPPTSERYARLEDTLEMLPVLWGKGSPSFEGRTFSATELMCYPRPIQDRIPLLIGGSGEEKTLLLAARHADACNLFGRPDVVRGKVEVLHAHCAAIERDPAEIEVTHLVNAMTASSRTALRERVERLRVRNMPADTFATRYNAATVEDQVAHFGLFQEAGATHSIVVLPDVHLDDSVETFGEVIQRLARPSSISG